MASRPIHLPDEARDLLVVASVSGGKDSTALILALLDAVVRGDILSERLRFVFADTGWEHADTYAYLVMLRARLGIQIDVVQAASGGMVPAIRARARFPGRMQRWCTKELKIEPLREYHSRLIASDPHHTDSVNVMGIRGDESAVRSTMPEWEFDDEWDGFLWRPLIAWSIGDVLEIHRRHGIPVNPLYQRGHDRVGCYPCIYAAKDEVRLVAKNSPERIDLIRELETYCTDERAMRNEEEPGRYKHPTASFFQTRAGRRVEVCDTHGDGDHGDESTCVIKRRLVDAPPMQIDEIVAWARTDRGGKQMPMFEPSPRGGCMRWGMCDTPTTPSQAPSAEEVNWGDPDADAPWVCSECGYEKLDSDPCGACGSVRVVTSKVIVENFGPGWRALFATRPG